MEQCGYFYKIRIPREGNSGEEKTIGYLFGELEKNKEEYNVLEYSVSQTSLE